MQTSIDTIASIQQHDRDEKNSKSDGINQARKSLHSVESHTLKTAIQITVTLAVIVWGWAVKGEEYLEAENGLGYALGIIGGSLMLILMFYPIRKKMKTARFLGSVPFWFELHMVLGVIGPIAILYHSNFKMGSLNSSIALICMIFVASSGLIGRYFYSKIHYGLYGKKASLDDLFKIVDDEEHRLATAYKLVPDIADTLSNLHKACTAKLSFSQSLKRFFVVGFKARLTALLLPFKLRKAINKHAEQTGWSDSLCKINYLTLKRHINNYLHTVIKTCEFSVYERMFGLWHILHLPLFIMMVISGIVHVFAVHMY